VLRVITRLNIGGPAIQAVSLSTGLARKGFETLLVHGRLGPGEGDMSYMLAKQPVHTLYLATLQRRIRPLADLWTFARLLRIIARYRPDIVHTHMAKAGLLTRAAAIVYNVTHPRRRRVILVHTYHGHVFEGYFPLPVTRVFIALERLLAHKTDALVAVSPRVREDLIARYRIGARERFIVSPLGFELEEFAGVDDRTRTAARRDLDIPPGTAVVTAVGRLTAIKNQMLFLEAATRLERPAIFLIVGDGEMRADLEQAARDRGIAPRVRFLGWRRDLPSIHAASDVFAITSLNEGTPVALIEAMAAGVAPVATDVGGVRDVIEDTSMGIVVPSEDAAALASAIGDLLDNPARRRSMATAARRSILARYTFATLTEGIASLYREIV
jgi:glycosyltransferase involved in cell wall biosynthesis